MTNEQLTESLSTAILGVRTWMSRPEGLLLPMVLCSGDDSVGDDCRMTLLPTNIGKSRASALLLWGDQCPSLN